MTLPLSWTDPELPEWINLDSRLQRIFPSQAENRIKFSAVPAALDVLMLPPV